MDKRFLLFFLIAFTILMGWSALMRQINPPVEKPPVVKNDADGTAPVEPKAHDQAADANVPVDGATTKATEPATSVPAAADGDNSATPEAKPAATHPLKHVTLGSLDPASKQRMLVTVTTKGAAVEMLEVTDRQYLDVVDRSGYIGYLALRNAKQGSGCTVGVVGAGTPAAIGGLAVGDVIVAVNGTQIATVEDFYRALATTRPRRAITLDVAQAGGTPKKLNVTPVRRPVSIIRPEYESLPLQTTAGSPHDPLSFLLTLDSVGDTHFGKLVNTGVDVRDVNWEIANQTDGLVELSYTLPSQQLTFVKRYKLAPGEATVDDDPLARAYHLTLEFDIVNNAAETQTIAYRLDGPTGLPTAGWWYANKVQRAWWATGLRDVARQLEQGEITLAASGSIVKEKADYFVQKDQPVDYIGVDALYFASILIPEEAEGESWIASSNAVTVGKLPEERKLPPKLTNVTCRLISKKNALAAGAKLSHSYTVFAGPKQRDLLTQYGPAGRTDERNLGELIFFGMPVFALFSKPLGWVLHMFSFVGNYGLAIIMLTICVRLCMFPISKKQAQNAMKMQELAPEMKRISEKYKKDMQKRSQALQEMYKKHNYSPLSGCLPLFIQMPIFIGLYKSLQSNIELRGAPLLGESIRWADNLSAPDMLLRWDSWMVFSDYTGWLGPYFNILPLCTVALFLWQQKLFTPPPTDEQSEMTQKMMKYMMFFMGLMFFKVPSGLCIYFVASSLWGIGERKLLPRPTPPDPAVAAKELAAKKEAARADSSPKKDSGNGGGKKKKKKGKR